MLRILASAVSVSERAGEIVREIMKQGELGIVEKGVNDLQTEADRLVQKGSITYRLRQIGVSRKGSITFKPGQLSGYRKG